jgi:ribosomal protein L11 methylase PrmA
VVGVDADRAAIDETGRNARANGVEVEVRHVDLRRGAAPVADAVAANLTAGLCEGVTQSWAADGVRPGTAIVSGFLREEADRVAAALRQAGLEEQRRVVSGEWAALLAA